MSKSTNSLANTRRALAASGVRLNAFGEPFRGNKIQGVQRKTYMGGGDQGPIYKRPTQATGTKGVEMEVERRERQALEEAARRGAERARAEMAHKSVVAPQANSVPLKPTQVPSVKAKNPAAKPVTPEAGMNRAIEMINKALPKSMKPIQPKTAMGPALREMRRKHGGLVLRSPSARSYAA